MQVQRPTWLGEEWVRPYVFMRKSNHDTLLRPGTAHVFDWFDKAPLVLDAQKLENLEFANQIMKVDSLVFGGADMVMPRWVFYDCAVVPGMVSGFAARRGKMPKYLEQVLQPPSDLEWVPLSLFITIPTLEAGHWVAHNLSSINEVLAKGQKLSGLGYLSKAFGLWYGNIPHLFGITQWGKPALKLHANYGNLELVTAYTPIHTKATSLTYRLKVDASIWKGFFGEEPHNKEFLKTHKASGILVNPIEESSLRDIQGRLERGDGPFLLNGWEILEKSLTDPLELYRPL